MATRIKDGIIPYTGGQGIEITNNHVINVLLREMNNLIQVNGDRELYVDLQLPDGIEPSDTFPVGVTTGKILQEDGWQQSGIILNWKTTSGDYVRLIYANDGKLYYDPGTGVWRLFGGEGEECKVKFFPMPQVGDNLSDIITSTMAGRNAGVYSEPSYLVVLRTAEDDTETTTWESRWIVQSYTESTSDPSFLVATHNGTRKKFYFDSNRECTSIVDESDACNTRTFYLSSTSDLATAQEAYSWYLDGKDPIVVLQNTSYTLNGYIQSPEQLIFMEARKDATTGASHSTINNKNLSLDITSGTVTAINLYNNPSVTGVLLAGVNYSAPYTPEYDGSPATKKYVDDSISHNVNFGSSAPNNPVAGMFWYDTANSTLSVYDGSAWRTV